MRPNTLLKGLAVLLSLGSTHAAAVPPLKYDITSDMLSDILNNSDNPVEEISTLLNAGININTKPVCDNSGVSVYRGDLVKAINMFCSIKNGDTLEAGQTIMFEMHARATDWYLVKNQAVMQLRMNTADGIDGVNIDFMGCATNFKRIVDECDWDLTHYKQGGTLISGGVRWFIEMTESK